MRIKLLVSLLAAAFATPAVLASTSGVVISQLYGAHGNVYASDYVELHNTSTVSVSLSGWSIQYASATGTGNFAGNGVTALSGSIAPGGYYLVKLTSTTSGTALPAADATGTLNLAGAAGKVVLANVATGLACNGGSAVCSAAQLAQIEDLVGYGTANFFEGSAAAPAASTSLALFRAGNGCTDTNNNAADFATGTPAPRNSASAALSCNGTPINQPIVPNCPDQTATAGTASSFAVSATDADSKVDKVTVVGSLPAGVLLGSFVAAAENGAAATQTFDVAASVAVGAYNIGLKWENDAVQSASCTVKLTVGGTITIPAIQGSGARSLMDGNTVTARGVVTKLLNNGFYLQDPDGDNDVTTSDGIFVYTNTAPTVAVGDKVSVTAKVQEYSVSTSAASQAAPLTELSSVSNVTVLSSHNALPQPVEVSLAALAAQADMERYEGMLVRIVDPLTVNQTNFVGSYGQLTLSAGGRTLTPTNVLRPGPAALALQAANLARSIVLDDGSSLQLPNPTPYLWQDGTVRAGDTVEGVVGVVDFGPSTDSTSGSLAYKIHPTAAPVFARPLARPVTPPAVGGNIKVASANVLNYFTSGTSGAFVAGSPSCSDCRGATSLTEFTRQRTKILAALSGLNADVVGLMEIQNNASNFAVQNLVDGLNATLGAGTYAAVPLPTLISSGGAGTGTDAIRVAMIYKPAKLALIGPSMADTHSINNRPTFAQGFVAPNGEKFAVAVNHLKSKGSCGSGANGDTGDLQGCWNLQRQQQAQRLLDWLPTVKSTAGTDDVILIGDFNAYAQEDPIHVLTSAGIVDLVGQFDPADYSYVFDASAGRLDHGLGTATIAPKVTGATSWHINADEPEWTDYTTKDKAAGNDWYQPTAFRASDHDPMLIGLNLVKSIAGTSGNDTIAGTDGDDVIEGGLGRDTITGKGGRNQFVYRTGSDGLDTVTDFVPGKDTLVFTALLKNVGITSADPLATGHVTCTAQSDGALIGYDPDGSAGSAASRPVVKLKGVLCSAISNASFKF
ncbi:ExeM/NucH family extracellular endonuclease [Roseateles sp. BYS96W]|uniref:ExeM/NucH family extracellular endonuclease n=1 Tax=Pelomonas nitida TaxID=3299027 RepID=A0ABW7FZY5_9BURK